MIIANMGSKMKNEDKLLKIQGAVKQMVANGESPDYIDNFLKEQGETPESIRAMNQYGVPAYVKMQQASQQAKAETETIPARLERGAKIAGAGAIGAGKGVMSGLESVLQGASMGGYGWLSDKLGLDYSQRQEEQQQTAEDAGLGGLNKAGHLMAELGGAIRSPIFKVLPNPMMAETMLGTAGRGALQGAVASGLQSAFKNDSLENVGRDATIGAAIGGTLPVMLRGAGRMASLFTGTTTSKGDEAIRSAYSAGQRGSKAFGEGKKMTAEEIVKTAQQGRDEIQKAASRAISQGKNAIADRPVDKQGLYDSLRDWAQERFMYNGTNLASKGEQKVLNDAEKIINKLTRNKDVDVKTIDVLKQQIYKIVPETSTDRAAIAARDAIYGRVSDFLNQAAPEYASVMRPYALAMEELKNIADTAGVKESGTKIATAINKLVKTSKNPETADIVKKIGGQELADRLAGYDLRGWFPESQIGRMLAAGLTGIGLGTGGSALTWLPLMSPKLVGNTAYFLGRASNYVPSASSTANILNYLRIKD